MMKSFKRIDGYNYKKTYKQLLKRWNTITYDEVKTVINKHNSQMTLDKLNESKSFKGTPIEFVDKIETDKETPVAFRNVRKGEKFLFVEPLFKKKYEDKAWTKSTTQSDGSKSTPIKENAFRSFDEFLTWALMHEKAHEYILKKDDETIGQYEDRINEEAFSKLMTNREYAIMKDILSFSDDVKKDISYRYTIPHYDYTKNPDGTPIKSKQSEEHDKVEKQPINLENLKKGETLEVVFQINDKPVKVETEVIDWFDQSDMYNEPVIELKVKNTKTGKEYVFETGIDGIVRNQFANGKTIQNPDITINRYKEVSTIKIKPGIPELFESNPELSNIGTQEQYSEYLDTVPDRYIERVTVGDIEGFKEFIEKGKITGKEEVGSIKPQSLEARNNALIDMMLGVLRDKNTVADMLTPGGFDYYKDIAAITRDKISKGEKNRSIFDIITQDELAIRNTTGKQLTGIAANHTAHHSLRQHFDLRLSKPVLFDGESFDSLSGKKAVTSVKIVKNDKSGHKVVVSKGDKVDRLISRNLSEILAAIVDNAKDPLASFINYTADTADVMSMIIGSGVDPHTAVFFMCQPIILHAIDIYKSDKTKPLRSVVNDLLKSYGIKDVYKVEPSNINTQELYDSLGTDDLKTDLQRDVLIAYSVYSKEAKDLGKLIRATTSDTKGLQSSIANGEVILEGRNKILADSDMGKFSITGVEDMFNMTGENDFNAGFTKYGIEDPINDVLYNIFPYTKQLFTMIKGEINDNIDERELTADERNYINKSIVNYVISDFDYFDYAERDRILKELPQELIRLQKEVTDVARPLLNTLKFEAKSNSIPMDIISFNTVGTLTEEQRDAIQGTWQSLLNLKNDSLGLRKFANDLIKYSFFTSGLSYNINGFAHLIPTEAYLYNIKDSHGNTLQEFLYNNDRMFNNIDFADNFIDSFYRHEYRKPIFVPQVTPDKSNVTTIDNNEITIDPDNVRTDNLFTKEYAKSSSGESYPVYKGKPFIVNVADSGEYNLYKLIPDIKGKLIYRRTFKLGIPNYMTEYNINMPGEESYIKSNNIPTFDKPIVAEKESGDNIKPEGPPSDSEAKEQKDMCSGIDSEKVITL